jgi:hypothetical protein
MRCLSEAPSSLVGSAILRRQDIRDIAHQLPGLGQVDLQDFRRGMFPLSLSALPPFPPPHAVMNDRLNRSSERVIHEGYFLI